MNFPLGVIIIVGVLAAIILGLIVLSPDDIIQPRTVSDEEMEIKSEPTTVTELEPEIKPEPETEPELEPETEPELEPETLPMSQTILIPKGVGVPGCETTTECYLPYEVNVAVGATVTWNNDDVAVHTVTSGNPSSGLDELFDSSIFVSGDSFEFTFNDAGTFDYFCMVHPWMVGIVNVS